ncbi:pro-sigmaK processing inhibitor BofA family protein [Halorhabdus amylolytica]|uniref:pro-sigmaK processing inhibitor BofA family protein n=1 Tax=Halorhabdus amylolytica TaxID=2559573 RepID=UPI0010AAF65B|nr:pro-sigmaK processing inhibitor BofA family protein [Halorhabdus amylolytica]
MVTTFEIAALLLVLGAVLGAYWIVKAVKPFIWNAIVGLVVLLLVEMVLGIEVAITPLVVLIVAIGGLPGAILVILLAVLEVAFVPGAIVFLL